MCTACQAHDVNSVYMSSNRAPQIREAGACLAKHHDTDHTAAREAGGKLYWKNKIREALVGLEPQRGEPLDKPLQTQEDNRTHTQTQQDTNTTGHKHTTHKHTTQA